MGKSGRKLPSPAMVVAIVALVFAVVGSAVAAVATVSVLSKKEKRQTRNIARDEINKAAPGLSVANATAAATATDATQLGGLGPEAFLRSDRLTPAYADLNAGTPQPLFSFPDLRATVTSDGTTGDFDRELVVSRTAGSGSICLNRSPTAQGISCGTSASTVSLIAPTDAPVEMMIYSTTNEADFVLLHCAIDDDPNQAFCYALRSQSH